MNCKSSLRLSLNITDYCITLFFPSFHFLVDENCMQSQSHIYRRQRSILHLKCQMKLREISHSKTQTQLFIFFYQFSPQKNIVESKINRKKKHFRIKEIDSMMVRRITAALREETFAPIHGTIAQAVVITAMNSKTSVDDTKMTSDAIFIVTCNYKLEIIENFIDLHVNLVCKQLI